MQAFNTGPALAALFPSAFAGFGFGAIRSAAGFFLCDFFGTPLSAIAWFAGCFALVGMLTHAHSQEHYSRGSERAATQVRMLYVQGR